MDIEARQVEAGRGWAWLVEGWQLFLKAPAPWIVMAVIYLAIGFVLSLIPVLGSLAHLLITPALMGGMLYGAAVLAQGGQLEIGYLFRAFQDQERLGPMLTLGAFLVGAIIIALLLTAGLAGGALISSSSHLTEVNADKVAGLLFGMGALAFLLILLFILLFILVIVMALFYGVPLVMLAGQEPWQSLQDSIMVCHANSLPFLVFGLVYIGLSCLAVLPLGLGFLLLLPVTFGALYASYRDVFPGLEAG
jgi:uncharacterized membrane protein